MNNILHNPVIPHSYDYSAYRNFVRTLAEHYSSTGQVTPERIEATRLNAQRMKRIEKQIAIRLDLSILVQNVKSQWEWIVLAESWCGDGAQVIPVLAKIAALNPNIKFKIVLRDENPELMDNYLTNGARAIPKLICLDQRTRKETGTWGPRPDSIARKVFDFKMKNPDAPHTEFLKNLHLWYAEDKGQSVQEDFLVLIEEWQKSK